MSRSSFPFDRTSSNADVRLTKDHPFGAVWRSTAFDSLRREVQAMKRYLLLAAILVVAVAVALVMGGDPWGPH